MQRPDLVSSDTAKCRPPEELANPGEEEVEVLINVLASGRTEVHCPYSHLCPDCLYETRLLAPRS